MDNKFSQKHKPSEIRLKKTEKILEVDFDDGKSFILPAELLRVESPSAEVQGHEIEPVGNYAIRIKFDDLHDTGIYSWDTLYMFGSQQEEMWKNYLKALEEAGESRDP